MPLGYDSFRNPLAIFGYGDIAMGKASGDLRLYQLSRDYRIGENDDLNDDPHVRWARENHGPFFRLCFESVESLDCVMQGLEDVREAMISSSAPPPLENENRNEARPTANH